MNENSVWKPTLLWHAKIFGVLLVCCLAAYFVLAYATAKLPAPYQKHRPSAQTTPWLNR